MRVSFLIVEWKGGNVLKECVASICNTARDALLTDYEIVVVNNNDFPLERADSISNPNVRIINIGRNAGFAGGTNISVREARFENIFLLNNDIILDKKCLSKLITGILSWNVGAVVPRLLDVDGKQQLSIRKLPTLGDILLESVFLTRLRPRYGGWILREFDYEKDQVVEQPMFSAIFMPKETWNTVGDLDPSFPILFNDVDWFYRFNNSGLLCAYIANAKAFHYHGMSVNRSIRKKIWNSTLGLYFYFHKNGSEKLLDRILLTVTCSVTFWGRLALDYGKRLLQRS